MALKLHKVEVELQVNNVSLVGQNRNYHLHIFTYLFQRSINFKFLVPSLYFTLLPFNNHPEAGEGFRGDQPVKSAEFGWLELIRTRMSREGILSG